MLVMLASIRILLQTGLPAESGRLSNRTEVSRGCTGEDGVLKQSRSPCNTTKSENLNTWHRAVDLPSGNHSSTSQRPSYWLTLVIITSMELLIYIYIYHEECLYA